MPSFSEERGCRLAASATVPPSALVSQFIVRAWARGPREGQMKETVSPAAPAFRAVLPSLLVLALGPVLVSVPTTASAANYGAEVVSYQPGTGAAPGYNQTSAALGEPSRVTPGDFGGPVDPFSSPWQTGQILSVGAGGSLTLRFPQPVLDQPGNPYGLDFLVFGSAAFLIVNGDFSGGGVTDGGLFGDNQGTSRVSVSSDGSSFFTLAPALAPKVDGLFPTDGAGDFSRPVNPALTSADFNGLDLAGIRERYAGSGGGMGYDLAWARDGAGQPVHLESIQFVRIDVLSDRAEIDAISAVPEPTPLALLGVGAAALLVARRGRRPNTV